MNKFLVEFTAAEDKNPDFAGMIYGYQASNPMLVLLANYELTIGVFKQAAAGQTRWAGYSMQRIFRDQPRPEDEGSWFEGDLAVIAWADIGNSIYDEQGNAK